MTLEESIITGVVSGILTSILIFVAIGVFNKIFLPWYRQVTYRAIDVSGVWSQTVEHEAATDYVELSLRQKEQYLDGDMAVTKTARSSGEVEIKNFRLEGQIVDGYLLLTGKNKDKTWQGYLTFLLKVIGDGQRLRGQTSWLDSSADAIISNKSEFGRK